MAAKHLVKAVTEFLVPVANQQAERLWAFCQSPRQLTGLLCHPRRARIRRATGDVHTAAAQLDEEEHVQPLQPNGLDCEEIDREHASPVRSHELTPCHPTARAGGSETLCPKPRAHRRRRHRHAKALQFADDALITPPRVVSRETDNQRSDLTADRRTSGSP